MVIFVRLVVKRVLLVSVRNATVSSVIECFRCDVGDFFLECESCDRKKCEPCVEKDVEHWHLEALEGALCPTSAQENQRDY